MYSKFILFLRAPQWIFIYIINWILRLYNGQKTKLPSKLPILRVPHLVFDEIINQMEMEDLISLSLCSKKMFHLIQFYRKNRTDAYLSMVGIYTNFYSIDSDWDVGENETIKRFMEAVKYEDQRSGTSETVTIANQCVPISHNNHIQTKHLRTHWTDPAFGFQKVTIHVSKLLKKEIKTVYFHSDSLWMLDWIKTFQNKLSYACIFSDGSLDDKQYVHVLEECNANSLFLYAKPPPSFEYKKELRERMSLSIGHGHWMTLEQLLKMRIPYVDIEGSKLTGAEMNAFLKHWRRGGSPQLKYLQIQVEGVSEEVYHGLWDQIVPFRMQRKFQMHVDEITIYAGFEIHQENDQRSKATTTFTRSKKFYLVVGDDFKEAA